MSLELGRRKKSFMNLPSFHWLKKKFHPFWMSCLKFHLNSRLKAHRSRFTTHTIAFMLSKLIMFQIHYLPTMRNLNPKQHIMQSNLDTKAMKTFVPSSMHWNIQTSKVKFPKCVSSWYNPQTQNISNHVHKKFLSNCYEIIYSIHNHYVTWDSRWNKVQ